MKYLSYDVSLEFPGWTGTSYVNQAGLKLTVIAPSLIPHDWLKGVCHHIWLKFFSIIFQAIARIQENMTAHRSILPQYEGHTSSFRSPQFSLAVL